MNSTVYAALLAVGNMKIDTCTMDGGHGGFECSGGVFPGDAKERRTPPIQNTRNQTKDIDLPSAYLRIGS